MEGLKPGGHNLFYLGRLQLSLLVKSNQTYSVSIDNR